MFGTSGNHLQIRMSAIPSSQTDRLDLLRRHVQILINQYGSILHSSSPYSSSTVNSNTDEAKLRSATLAITSSVKFLLDLVHDLRMDSLLLLQNNIEDNSSNNSKNAQRNSDNPSGSGNTSTYGTTNHSDESAMDDI